MVLLAAWLTMAVREIAPTTRVYLFTDLEGRTRRYTTSRPFRESRTVLALPDEDSAVEWSRHALLSSSGLWVFLFLSPFLLVIAVSAVVCVPGLLLAWL
ncbi:hypothetical protein [Kitasatospora sp. NPDC017646]|uniref:hypothetical protein n=1 Tax=Kitasatospora sp. NPDC017646 TaxID=3364024 RepID=UPI0037BC49BC